jgi:hypothetical protein
VQFRRLALGVRFWINLLRPYEFDPPLMPLLLIESIWFSMVWYGDTFLSFLPPIIALVLPPPSALELILINACGFSLRLIEIGTKF